MILQAGPGTGTGQPGFEDHGDSVTRIAQGPGAPERVLCWVLVKELNFSCHNRDL